MIESAMKHHDLAAQSATNCLRIPSTRKEPAIGPTKELDAKLPSRIACSRLPCLSWLVLGPGECRHTYNLSLTARVVVLDVVVTDRKGKLVHRDDLMPAGSSIFKDGTPQTIRSLEASSKHRMATSGKPVVDSTLSPLPEKSLGARLAAIGPNS